MNDSERRKNPRIPIRRLAYVNLEPYDNGGVITDLSPDGLRFHMVNPVEQGGLVRLSILFGAGDQLQLVGELVWLDASRKVGAVRFASLPTETTNHIVEWAKANNPEAIPSGVNRAERARQAPLPKFAPPMPAMQPTAEKLPPKPIADPAPNSTTLPHSNPAPQVAAEANPRPTWVPPSARIPRDAPSVSPQRSFTPTPGTAAMPPFGSQINQPAETIPPSTEMPWITHFDPDPPAQGSVFLRGMLGGVVLCALLAAGAWLAVRHYGWQNSLAPYTNFGVSKPEVSGPPVLPEPSQPSTPAAVPRSPESDNPASAKPQALPQAPPAPSASPTAGSRQPTPDQRTTPAPSGPDNGGSQTSSAAVAGVPRLPNDVAASQSPAPATQASAAASGSGIASPQTDSSRITAQQSANSPAAQAQRTPDPGESQLMLARQYLDGLGRPRNAMVASQLLWSAVEKGNSAAEMDLADLYLHGDGVARNCDQARVLLSVASQKGNVEAIQKLTELNRTGCR